VLENPAAIKKISFISNKDLIGWRWLITGNRLA